MTFGFFMNVATELGINFDRYLRNLFLQLPVDLIDKYIQSTEGNQKKIKINIDKKRKAYVY